MSEQRGERPRLGYPGEQRAWPERPGPKGREREDMSGRRQASFCRACMNMCPVVADVEDGRLVRISGDRENTLFNGFTCVKGRAQPHFYNHPQRLLHSQKRMPDGTYAPIRVDEAMDEIADALGGILERHGPRAVAAYIGTYLIASAATEPLCNSFLHAIGSPMSFTPNTIDKPGKMLAAALHGRWMAPEQGYDRPEAALLIGCNPFQSYYGVACGNPGHWLGERLRAGMELIVIDPRRTDVAKRATLHLQPVPGEDIAILAALVNVILAERLYDAAFVEENADGLEELRRVTAAFAPDVVGARADVAPDDLVRAARVFAGARRGYAAAGVGAGFSASSTLVEYLVLDLETLCGHWLRAGERVVRTPSFVAMPQPKAQASPPRPAFGFGERMRVHGLTQTSAGMPTGVLADEILLEGDGQVRALLSCAGNPVAAWPDQLKTLDALATLELLVQIDPWMSATARVAHYVIAPKMAYEVPGITFTTDLVMAGGTWYGPAESYAQYTDVVVDPPMGSDLIEEWEFFYGLSQRMGIELTIGPWIFSERPREPLDMTTTPTTVDLIERLARGGRISVDEVRAHPHGATFPDPPVVVAPKDDGWTARLQLADPNMMRDLATVFASPGQAQLRITTGGGSVGVDTDTPFRLVTRRMQHTMNSSFNDPATNHGRAYNPAFLHPDDLAALGLAAGDAVEIRSRRGRIPAIAAPDDTLRRGLVSMSHCFGDGPDRDGEFREIGSPTARLLDNADFADPYVGMPRISNIPVAVTRLVEEPA